VPSDLKYVNYSNLTPIQLHLGAQFFSFLYGGFGIFHYNFASFWDPVLKSLLKKGL
jgi:hypothetical protein